MFFRQPEIFGIQKSSKSSKIHSLMLVLFILLNCLVIANKTNFDNLFPLKLQHYNFLHSNI